MTRVVSPEEPPEIGAAKLYDLWQPHGPAERPERAAEQRNALSAARTALGA